ncbi:hypothetical protein BST61_g10167 [Cercospora zeina]
MESSQYGLTANPSPSNPNFRATPQALYNDLGKAYGDAYKHNQAQIRSLQWLLPHLPPSSRVLDLGCETGVPASKLLSEGGLSVTGIDISPTMLSHARNSAPRATFIEADIRSYVPGSGGASVDAVVAYFCMIGHVSQEDIRDV